MRESPTFAFTIAFFLMDIAREIFMNTRLICTNERKRSCKKIFKTYSCELVYDEFERFPFEHVRSDEFMHVYLLDAIFLLLVLPTIHFRIQC